jgi:pilus assembly protein CpaC
VSEGKSFVVNSAETIKRVSVTSDQIATAIVISPNQVLIHGLKAGTVSFLLWNDQEQVRAFDLQVLAVPMNLEPLRATLSRVFPGQDIRVSQSGSSVVLTGMVSSAAIADQAASVAKTEAGNVVSLLAVAPLATQIVMLEVKFAEVDRSAVQQLGANILSTGATNTIGTVSTQQYSPPSAASLSSAIGIPVQGFPSNFTLTSLLNIFVFRPDLNLGMLIQALQQKSLLQTLAEPNLLATGGKEASFLAGGEFPVPIIQGTTGTPTVSVQYKEYGVRLKFVANPNPDGTITLHVAPEVSELDYTNAVTLSGFLIPALTTRRAETEIQLKDGQSFAIAGLLDNRVSKIFSKIPGLGDLPILGKLFQSTNFTKSKTELLVMISPHLVRPLDPGQIPPLPSYPVPFLNPDKFDGKSGQTPAVKPAKQPG